MKLPFVEILQKWKARTSAPAATVVAAAPVARIEKPASERFGKTVTPNVARGAPSSSSASSPSSSSSSSSLPASPIPAPPSKTISLGGNGAPAAAAQVASRETSTASAAERTIALQLTEIIPQLPPGLLRAAAVDPQQRILLRASDLERGMADGRPTVPLRTVYQQVPEIFSSEVSATDPREVTLPFAKVLEQFVSRKVRGDRVHDPAGPQIETPFLKVAREAGERFATLLPGSQIPATTVAPEAPAKIQLPAPIRLSPPKTPNASAAGSPTEAPIRREQVPARPPAAIKIPPNGTGAPAIERVPASGRPPVLTSSPALAAPPALPKISFKTAPPASASAPGEAEPLAFSRAEARIRLSLRAVLRGIPPFQLDGAIDQVPAAARIELPFSIVQPQLPLGRIAISPAQFHSAMPEEYRHFFKLDEGGMPVSLPLPEVLQNLPNESLQLRGDQVETEIAESFETPFSQKAAEDAARLKVPAGPITKADPGAIAVAGMGAPDETDDPGKTSVDSAGMPQNGSPPGSPTPATSSARSALQTALGTDDAIDTLDAKSIVAHASRLPGVGACAIVFSDGLSLAGNIPAEYEADALCAIAPSIVRRINDQMLGAHFGALQGLTLFCAKTPVSFFTHGNICLAALHSAGDIAAEIRARLNATTEELARIYAQPA